MSSDSDLFRCAWASVKENEHVTTTTYAKPNNVAKPITEAISDTISCLNSIRTSAKVPNAVDSLSWNFIASKRYIVIAVKTLTINNRFECLIVLSS